MAEEIILLKFFIILFLLFFIPKIIKRFYRIPFPITEITLGLLLGMLLPEYFYAEDALKVLSTLGIVTLFVHSGMEVDFQFIAKNRRFFIENMILHLAVIGLVGYALHELFSLTYQVAYLASLALTTPSASYIISSNSDSGRNEKPWIEGKAIAGEVASLILMIFLYRIDNPANLILTIVIIGLLLFMLPKVLRFLYDRVFSKMIGTEFSFIFAVAMISALITDIIGLHFLLGAFIAGVVSRRFISDLVKDEGYIDVSSSKGKQIVVGFGFFSLVFAPFFFYTTGLSIKPEIFTWTTLGLALLFGLAIAGIRILIIAAHRMFRVREKFPKAARISAKMLPTLVFTFVISEMLVENFGIDSQLFNTLMIYGILTALISLGFDIYFSRRSERKSARKEADAKKPSGKVSSSSRAQARPRSAASAGKGRKARRS